MPDDDGYDSDLGGFTPQEFGFPAGPPSPAGGLPPGGGRYTVPNFLSFSALVRGASKAYLFTTDEALKNSVVNARAMRRDPVLIGALRSVQRQVSQLSWHITPDDDTDPAQSEAAKLIEYCVKQIPRFQKMKMQLLEAIWFGKYAVEVVYEWREHRGEQVLFVRDFIPINGDKIHYRWDGTPGFTVYGGYPGTTEPTDYGIAHFLTADERLQYIIHEHEPDDADWLEPEMAGAIHGVGVRGRLYWFWWLKQQIFGQLMNYIHRFANGLTIFYYDASNPQAKREAEQAARQQFSNTALLYPRWNSQNPDVNNVERLEVSTANANILWNLVSEYFDPIMERYIKGQTLSSHAEATGLGSGVAELHSDTEDAIIKYHAIDLQETFQTDLINVLYSYNAPGIKPGKFEYEVDSPDADKLMDYGQTLFEWGVPLDEEQAYKISQWQKPKPGGGVITQIGAMQPAAIGAPQQGMPVAGAQPGGVDPSQMMADPAMAAQMQGGLPQGAPMAMSRRGKVTNGKHRKEVSRKRVVLSR